MINVSHKQKKRKACFYDKSRDLYGYTNFMEGEDQSGCLFHIEERVAEDRQYVISRIKNNKEAYRDSYFFMEKSQELFYVNEKEIEPVRIDNMEKFHTAMMGIMENEDKRYSTRYFSVEQIHELITLNGGHKPAKTKTMENNNECLADLLDQDQEQLIGWQKLEALHLSLGEETTDSLNSQEFDKLIELEQELIEARKKNPGAKELFYDKKRNLFYYPDDEAKADTNDDAKLSLKTSIQESREAVATEQRLVRQKKLEEAGIYDYDEKTMNLLSSEELDEYLEKVKSGPPIYYDKSKDLYFFLDNELEDNLASSTNSLADSEENHQPHRQRFLSALSFWREKEATGRAFLKNEHYPTPRSQIN